MAPYYLTLHAGGGEAMLRAARATAYEEAARLSLAPPRLLAVTVLTSLDENDLAQQGITGTGVGIWPMEADNSWTGSVITTTFAIGL